MAAPRRELGTEPERCHGQQEGSPLQQRVLAPSRLLLEAPLVNFSGENAIFPR